MTRVLLVRHGRTSANASGVLAGRSPGVHLDDIGIAQASAVGELLQDVPVTHIVTSPLPRTVETAKLIRARLQSAQPLRIAKDKGLLECDYGDWSGRTLKKLARDPLWGAVQAHPSSVTFPGGESMLASQTRAVGAVRKWSALAEVQCAQRAVVLIVSHGDIIKSVVADALGMHLDAFQRIVIDPGSVTAIDYTALRPFVRLVNGTGDVSVDLQAGIPSSSDAALGGGAGSKKRRK
ncbi:MAG: MSMEG_4193 family putative phosphomutase [Candidatus Nanopelagicales bacterium]